MEERRGRRTRSWSSAEKWINICLCDEILRLWPLTPRLIWFQQQSTSLKLLSNQKWMALNWGVLRRPLPAKKYQINVYVSKVRWWWTLEIRARSPRNWKVPRFWFWLLKWHDFQSFFGLKELVIHGWLCCNLSSIGLKYQCIVKWLDDGPLMPSPIFDWILNDVAFARYDSPDFVLVGDALWSEAEA